jgi:hypothetical protein
LNSWLVFQVPIRCSPGRTEDSRAVSLLRWHDIGTKFEPWQELLVVLADATANNE